MPDIQNVRTKPKYASGNHRFSKFEDLYWWLITIRALAKATPGRWLYDLAKSGQGGSDTALHVIEIRSDRSYYSLARDTAQETGLLKSGPGDNFSLRKEDALAFARRLDSILIASEN